MFEAKFNRTREPTLCVLSKVQIDGAGTRNTDASVNVSYEYYDDGKLKSVTYPALTDSSILKSEYVYDGLSRLTSLTNYKGTEVLSSYAYTYDSNGNILTTIENVGTTQNSVAYTYDKLNRIASVAGTKGADSYYEYDTRGNRKANFDQIDFLSEESATFIYDAEDKLVRSQVGDDVTSFEYSSNGYRYFKKENSSYPEYYIYDSDGRLQAIAAAATLSMTDGSTLSVMFPVTHYIWGSDRVLAKIDRITNQSYYYLYNGHGDVVQIVDTSGAIKNTYDYDVWGNFLKKEETIENHFTYFGQTYDETTGLYYLRARYYDPATSRMLSEDPAKQGLNWYVYCSNNPVNRIDPSGLKDYVYTSQTDYYVENDWGFWEFLNTDRYYAEIGGSRYQANSKETVTLYDWNSFDTDFLNGTLDSLVSTANTKTTNAKRILSQSVGGDLDFKLQMDKEKLYLANGILYNRNEAGNFVWAYFLESQNYSGYISGALAQGGSIISPMINMNGLPRLDEEWDRQARWSGVKYYYDRNNSWWVYYLLYGGRPKY